MVVAQIAYNHLKPEVKLKCNALIALPVYNSTTANSNFVTAACWADDIKSFTSVYNNWHYIDIPFSLDGTPTNTFVPPSFDVVQAINQCVAALQNPSTSISNQAMNLRLLIHFVGDIQQPLHCTTSMSAAHPSGDGGGNGFSLNYSPNNLHSLWDQGAGYLTDSVGRPLSAGGQNNLNNKVANVETAHPYAPVFTSIPNPMNWAVEGLQLSQTNVYVGITESNAPSGAYLTAGQNVSRQRMAAGGQRLADLLNVLFGAKAPGNITGTRLTNGTFQLGFTNVAGASFSVWTSTNVMLPLSNWTSLGSAAESPAASGNYQFIDSQSTNNVNRFYRVRLP